MHVKVELGFINAISDLSEEEKIIEEDIGH